MAVLVGVIAPQFLGYAQKAKESILKYNTQGVYDYMIVKSVDYSKDAWWKAWNDNYSYDEKSKSLNGLIEYELVEDGNDTANDINIINPYNDSQVILNYSSSFSATGSLPEAYCPALFMTDGSKYAYEKTGNTENLIGTVVAYFKVTGGTTEYIQFYYVNEDGSKSDFVQKW